MCPLASQFVFIVPLSRVFRNHAFLRINNNFVTDDNFTRVENKRGQQLCIQGLAQII
jgi:hypothetical protein